VRQGGSHGPGFDKESGPVDPTPYPEPDKEARSASTANGSEGTGSQADEKENSSGNDGNDLVAEQCEKLILQTSTSETP
jgi:hypothetical protein